MQVSPLKSQTLKLLMTFLALILISSCVTRKQIEAATWVNNFHVIPAELCYPGAALHRVGFFRRLDDGRFQLVSVCAAQASKMLSVTAADYQKLLDAATKGK